MKTPVLITGRPATPEDIALSGGLTAKDVQWLRDFLYSRGHLSSPEDPARGARKARAVTKRRKG